MVNQGGGDRPWVEVRRGGKHGEIIGSQVVNREPGTLGETSRFAKSYSWGLKNDWFSALKNAERMALDEAFRAAEKCPRTVMVQIPIGFHGGVDQVLDGVRVSLCRLKVEGGTRHLKPGTIDSDFHVTSNSCSTLVVVTFSTTELKEEVVKVGKIPFWKKKGPKDEEYSKSDKDLRVIDLIKPKVTLVVTNYINELNDLYNQALKLFYSGTGVEVTIEEGIKEQYIDMGGGDGYKAQVYDGRKYVKLGFEGEVPPMGSINDGKIQLDLEGVGLKTVYVRQLGKQYSCDSCGGLECERFYCINKCVFCRRDLRSGHRQSDCEERGWVDSGHNRKTRDIERVWRDWYTPAVVQGSSPVEVAKILEERSKVHDRLEAKMGKTIDYRINEAKGKVRDVRDTPYTPMDMGSRGRNRRREGSREESLTDALREGAGVNKKIKSSEVKEGEIINDEISHKPASEIGEEMEQGGPQVNPNGGGGDQKVLLDAPTQVAAPNNAGVLEGEGSVDIDHMEELRSRLPHREGIVVPTEQEVVFKAKRLDVKGREYGFVIDNKDSHYCIMENGVVVFEKGGKGDKWGFTYTKDN